MKPTISIDGLSKVYNINHQPTDYITLRDSIASMVKKPLQLLTGKRQPREKFWALKDVTTDIFKGDVVGIVGRNGSGKSTLLKVLSRIVEPTAGQAILRGSAASLLEVGTGFHPELTGRENIYFNGAILGMSQREIKRKFQEIVDFSEVEKFLDTPVKFYSSGMYVRLAFAVAAHLEPDILIVDEVLAVGDAQFQKKCLGKMNSVAKEGRTVLFVSHNMGAVKQLCTRGILMEQGHATAFDDVSELVSAYMESGVKASDHEKLELAIKPEGMLIYNLQVNGTPAESEPAILSGEELVINLEYRSEKPGQDLCVGLALKSRDDGVSIAYTHSHLEEVKHTTGAHGSLQATLHIPQLAAGSYSLEINVWMNGRHYIMDREFCPFTIVPVPSFSSNITLANFPSRLIVRSDWEFKYEDSA